MRKIVSLKKVSSISASHKKAGEKTGLIIGGFDILHLGHINLFRHAKKYCDILIIGLDNDTTLKNTKGENRPINSYKRRSEFLSELSLVDYIFKIDGIFKHGDSKSTQHIKNILISIGPDIWATSVKCDNLWKEKKSLAKSLGIKFIVENTAVTHSSEILKKLSLEN